MRLAAILRQLADADVMDGDTNDSLRDAADRLEQCASDATRVLDAIATAEAACPLDLRTPRVQDVGDHLELRIGLPNARLRVNRYPGDPMHVEAVEFDGGEVGVGEGFSPPLADAAITLPDEMRAALEAA